MKFCQNCGTKLEESWSFCQGCGEALTYVNEEDKESAKSLAEAWAELRTTWAHLPGYVKWVLVSFLGLSLLLILISVIRTPVSDQSSSVAPEQQIQQAPASADQEAVEQESELPRQTTGLLSFTLLKDNSFEDAGTAKVIWEILVGEDVTKESLTGLLNDLYSQALSKGFAQHDEATVIDIKAYMSKEHAESGQGQWIGWISKSGSESQPNMTFDDRQISELSKNPEDKLGLSEEKRKEIWQEIIRAEDRANHDDQLIDQYRNELAQAHGLSRQQLDEIANEGLQKSWPFPEKN